MAEPISRKAAGHQAGEEDPPDLDFAAVKILLSSYPRVMGMLVGLSASLPAGDFFARLRARPQPDGELLIVAPMPDGTRREIRVPAGDWRLSTGEERDQAAAARPSAFDLRDRRRD